MKKRNIIIISFIFILIDQIIKLLIVKNVPFNSDIIIIKDFLSITNISNSGAALGILSNNILFLIFVSTILIFYVLNEIKNSNEKLTIISLLLILGGSLGNLFDRIFRGYVVDYISFTIFNRSMPVFNFADMIITIGVIMIVFLVIKGGLYENSSK